MLARNKILIAGLALFGSLGSAHADFEITAPNGRHWKGTELDGGAPNGPQRRAVQDAIDKLRAAGEISCADGLQKMLKKCRICVESGNVIDDASVKPDKKCGAEGDGMHVAPRILGGDSDVLCCTLAHEWVHVNQKGGMTRAKRELEAYCYELACLCRVQNPNALIRQRKRVAACRKLKYARVVRRQESGNRAMLTSTYLDEHVGAHILFSGGDSFADIVPDGPTFYSAGTTENLYTLAMATPLDLELVPVASPTGGAVVVVSGTDASGSGVLQYLDIDEQTGAVVSSLATVPLGAGVPLAVQAIDWQGTVILWYLDPVADEIRTLLDGDGDGLPDFALPFPYATAATFPSLASAEDLVRLNDTDFDLFVTSKNLHFGGGLPEDDVNFDLLQDTNQDFVAEAVVPSTGADIIALAPAITNGPYFGETTVDLFGSPGALIHVHDVTDAGQLGTFLGAVTLDGNGEGSLPLATPLVELTRIAAEDQTGTISIPWVPLTVRATRPYGSACPTAGGHLPTAYLPEDASLGSTSRWSLIVGEPNQTVSLMLSFSTANTPLDMFGAVGCTLLVGPASLTLTTQTNLCGDAVATVPVPNDPALVGLDLFGQYVVYDAASPGGFVTSNGVGVRVIP
ncbi:MAG: hypothetical protein AAF726_20170 [Planctomycetota bacterium]